MPAGAVVSIEDEELVACESTTLGDGWKMWLASSSGSPSSNSSSSSWLSWSYER